MTQEATRPCPYCQEQIQPRAIKCRFCGESIGPGAVRRRRAGRVDTSSEPTTILVFGILGLVVCAIFGPFAWLRGNEYLRRCKARNTIPNSTANVGRILGMVSTIMLGLYIVGGILWFVLMAGASAVSGP